LVVEEERVLEEHVLRTASFIRNLPEKVQDAIQRRNDMDKAILRKEKDIIAMKERLFLLRYDSSLSQDDLVRSVKNHIRELKRLEAGLHFLRLEAWEEFETSLDLSSVGMSPHCITNFAQKYDPSTNKPAKVLIQDPRDEELENVYTGFMSLKMMRTKSTATLEDQTPSQKWQSLMKMFQEWRHNTTLAEARQILNKQDKQFKTEQIAKCRAAIMSILNQKTRSKSDEVLLQQLRYRLRKLNGEV